MTEIVPTKHARLSPSAAHRWMPCPGSIVMEEGIPDTSSEFADEGTAAHELAGWCLKDGTQARGYLGRIIEVPSRDKKTSSKWEVTEEMADYVQEYVDAIRAKAEGNELMIEEKVDFSRYVGVPESFGTSDAIIMMEAQKELNVDDLKYGRGVRVDATNNQQLMIYALGAYDIFAPVYEIETVRLTIHQPRLSHVSEWVISVEELLKFAEDVAGAADQVTLATNFDDGPAEEWNGMFLNPGPKQCQWCKAKATCPALRNFIVNEVIGDFDVLTDEPPKKPKPAPNDDAELAHTYGLIDLMAGYIKAVGTEMHARMMAGRTMPGYKLVEGKKGARAWVDEAEAESTLKSFRMKLEEMYSMKLISPTQAEKVLKGKNPKRWNKVLKLITQSDGQPHIALESDKRKPLVIQPITDDFADETASDLV